MNYFSICDGIGAAHAALLPLGYNCVGVSEIDKNCNELIRKKYGFKNFGSLTEWRTWEHSKADLVIAGTPCQSFSTLGSMQGPRAPTGRLTLDFVDLVCKNNPQYFLWENVAAVLFIDRGQLFQWMLSRFMQCGYGVAWRILDSRFFGIPQSRRRMFLVGCFGDSTRAGKILFETKKMPVFTSKMQTASKENSRTSAISDYTDRIQSGMDSFCERYRYNNPFVGTLACQIDSGSEQVNRLVVDNNRPRYLTPLECERLQGFPDNYTEGFSDCTRYRMIGNSMPVPVIRWIAQRILLQEQKIIGWSKAG
jgi:DNA (cytosine-5)-methyltransferase 1